MSDNEKDKEYKTFLLKAANYCGYQERCTLEVVQKLEEWEVNPEIQERVLKELREEKYLDDNRFAASYARGKFRIKKWGRRKIVHGLKVKGITNDIILAALRIIDDEEYIATLRQLIEKKRTQLNDKNPLSVKGKLLRYAQSKGYEQEIIFEML